MKLLTKQLEQQFKTTGRQEGHKDPLVIAKFFCPRNSWTRYATEYDPENGEFFGVVDGHEKERGYFALYELLAIQWPYGLRIERDAHFQRTPCTELNLPVYAKEEQEEIIVHEDSKFAL